MFITPKRARMQAVRLEGGAKALLRGRAEACEE